MYLLLWSLLQQEFRNSLILACIGILAGFIVVWSLKPCILDIGQVVSVLGLWSQNRRVILAKAMQMSNNQSTNVVIVQPAYT